MDIFERMVASENEASQFGFKWESADQITDQIRSEISEIHVHLKDHDQTKLQEEIGDLLHAAFSLCVFCQFDPHETLTMSIDKFTRRLQNVKKLANAQGLQSLHGKSFAELMDLWNKAKLM